MSKFEIGDCVEFTEEAMDTFAFKEKMLFKIKEIGASTLRDCVVVDRIVFANNVFETDIFNEYWLKKSISWLFKEDI